MINHYYTLLRQAEDFKQLTGCVAAECFTQEKDSLVIEFDCGGEYISLIANLGPKWPCVYLRDNFARARKNTLNLFECLEGETLQKAEVLSRNRIMKLSFADTVVYFQLFGGRGSNMIAVNREHIILEAFQDNAAFEGKKYLVPEGRLKKFEEFLPGDTVFEALSKSDVLAGPRYARQILGDANIEIIKTLGELHESDLADILKEAQRFQDKCANSDEFYVYSKENSEPLFSLVKLRSLGDNPETFSDINAAIRRKYALAKKMGDYIPEKIKLTARFERSIKKIEKKLEGLNMLESSEGRAEKYKYWAQLLMAQPNPKSKQGEKIEITGWQAEPVIIPLDMKLSILGNAEKYFDKSRKTMEDMEARLKLAPEYQRDLDKLKKAAESLNKAESLKDIEKFRKENAKLREIRMDYKDDSPESKYRVFDLGEGYTLYAGKSAANNDELTMKFAKPNDLWFHARGAQGSHCVLRMGKKDRPGKYILQKAASIAAYYSKAKNAKLAPVAYTFKKYVRKPKGANPGSVVISREEVIMAEPRLPE